MTCQIVGNTAIIQSAFTLANLLKVADAAPGELTLYGGADGKEPVFKISFTTTEPGQIGKYGISYFVGNHPDPTAKPSISVTLDTDGDKKEFVAKKYGAALMSLAKLEQGLHGVLAEIEREHAEILGAITVL